MNLKRTDLDSLSTKLQKIENEYIPQWETEAILGMKDF